MPGQQDNPPDQTILMVTVAHLNDTDASDLLSSYCAKGFHVVGFDGGRVLLTNYKE